MSKTNKILIAIIIVLALILFIMVAGTVAWFWLEFQKLPWMVYSL